MSASVSGPFLDSSVRLPRERARAVALEAGFVEAGLAALPYAAELRDAERFRAWVEAGRAGTMRYLERKTEDGWLVRARVAVPFPWARSALVCFASYHSPAPLSTETPKRGSAWIARYAWTGRTDPAGAGRPTDYHKVLLKRLKAVDARLHQEFGAFQSRAYVDTGPIVERSLALAAGLGWIGKNTCLIHPRLGSFGFLAVLLMSLDVKGPGTRDLGLERHGTREQGRRAGGAEFVSPALQRGDGGSDKRTPESRRDGATALPMQDLTAPRISSLQIPDRCGSCTRCLDACPTKALIAPYQMDASRCISYLTIEHKGPIAEDLMPGMGRQVFGCDICQDVCPWNRKSLRKAPVAADPEFAPRAELVSPALDWLGSLDEQSFERIFNGSPVRRAGFWGLHRNVAVAMGNSGLRQFAPTLAEWASAADEGLRAAARWALARLRRN